MLWVLDGQARWARAEGAAGKACADCHGTAPAERLRGVAAAYPTWDAASGRPVNLGERIAACRSRHQGVREPSAPDALLALEAAVAHASRGLPVTPPEDPRLQPWRARGPAPGRQRDSPGPCRGLPHLPAGVAGAGQLAAAHPQLQHGRAGRTLEARK
jgi:sulfur-oxidizing protein SoxA